MVELAKQLAPGAAAMGSVEEVLKLGVDGVVIATPSALHAEEAIAALENGTPVFCQKPLGRSAEETGAVIAAARKADRLLGVDLSYRHLTEACKIYDLCRAGELGDIYIADLVFHNAYGPAKEWFYNRTLSGGGCVIDLGIHLVDLALWTFGFPRIVKISSHLFSNGRKFAPGVDGVEDYADAMIDLETGATIRIACSWNLPAGCDAIITGSFYGTRGGAAFHNVEGSFYKFRAERYNGTKRETLACSEDQWGGRAAVNWVKRLGSDRTFDPEIESLIRVAEVLDGIYQGTVCGNPVNRPGTRADSAQLTNEEPVVAFQRCL